MRLARSLPLLLALLLLGSSAAAAPGDLDPTFSSDGMVVVDASDGDLAFGLAVQEDGGILQVGGNGDFMVVRYTQDGEPDPAFGEDGIVTTDFGGGETAHGVLALPDGKVLAVGSTHPRPDPEDERLFALARYNADGTLDTSFGGDGRVTTPFVRWATALDAVPLADGSVVVVGYRSDIGVIDWALAKYRPDGALDNSFSGDGKRTLDFFGGFDVPSDIVAAGSRLLVSGSAEREDPPFSDVAVARFKKGGALDKRFSGDGKRMLSLSPINDDRAEGLVRLDDGRFVVAAYVQEAGEEDVGLVKFKPRGKLDLTFGGGDGKVVVDLGGAESLGGLARIGNGYAVGIDQFSEGMTVWSQMGVARFGPRGGLVTGFGTGGLALATFPNGSSATAVVNQEGKIVVGGFTDSDAEIGVNQDFAAARFLTA